MAVKNITHYHTVVAPVTGDEFTKRVTSKLSEGYQPFGAPFMTRDRHGNVIGHQIMVIYTSTNDTSP